MAKFRYDTLEEEDSIRLLLLQPASSSETRLEGSLLHTTHRELARDIIHKFTALSYAWGGADLIDSIWLDSSECKITANLGTALRDIRHTAHTHHIWADALCINQKDTREKNHQVSMMGKIYSSADNTVIHLGPLDYSMHIVFHLINGEQPLSFDDWYELSNREQLEFSKEWNQVLRNAGLYTGDASAIIYRPWFKRVWVFQELVLAQVPWVQCGRLRVRWDELYDYLKPVLPLPNVLDDMNSARREGAEGRTLFHLLRLRSGCKLTDPRDIVFAHMGIVSDTENVAKYIVVDYSQTTQQVLISAARYAIASFGIRSILDTIKVPSSPLHSQFIGPRTKQVSQNGIPSWVPHWNLERLVEDFSASTPFEKLLLWKVDKGCHPIDYLSDPLPNLSEIVKCYGGKEYAYCEYESIIHTTINKAERALGLQQSTRTRTDFSAEMIQLTPTYDMSKYGNGSIVTIMLRGWYAFIEENEKKQREPFRLMVASETLALVPVSTSGNDFVVNMTQTEWMEYQDRLILCRPVSTNGELKDTLEMDLKIRAHYETLEGKHQTEMSYHVVEDMTVTHCTIFAPIIKHEKVTKDSISKPKEKGLKLHAKKISWARSPRKSAQKSATKPPTLLAIY